MTELPKDIVQTTTTTAPHYLSARPETTEDYSLLTCLSMKLCKGKSMAKFRGGVIPKALSLEVLTHMRDVLSSRLNSNAQVYTCHILSNLYEYEEELYAWQDLLRVLGIPTEGNGFIRENAKPWMLRYSKAEGDIGDNKRRLGLINALIKKVQKDA